MTIPSRLASTIQIRLIVYEKFAYIHENILDESNLDDIEIDTKEIIDLETNELDIELLSSEEIENMYKEDTNNANSI